MLTLRQAGDGDTKAYNKHFFLKIKNLLKNKFYTGQGKPSWLFGVASQVSEPLGLRGEHTCLVLPAPSRVMAPPA